MNTPQANAAVVSFFVLLCVFFFKIMNTDQKIKLYTWHGDYQFEVINTHNLKVPVSTQGLFYFNDLLFESSGGYGTSVLRVVDPENNLVIQALDLDSMYYGEGCTEFKGDLYQLTWKSKKGFIYDIQTLEKIGEFNLPSQGWGLTSSRDALIFSNGTNKISFMEPGSFEIVKTIKVRDGFSSVNHINELEYVDDILFGNVYGQDQIILISPNDGHVIGHIDLSFLRSELSASASAGVLNGIAYNFKNQHFFITGKNWGVIYEGKLKPID